MEGSSLPLENHDTLGCHICKERPSEPVATSCGHVFCWPCIYTWIGEIETPCPVCRNLLLRHHDIISLYGAAVSMNEMSNNNNSPKVTTAGPSVIPPRPTNHGSHPTPEREVNSQDEESMDRTEESTFTEESDPRLYEPIDTEAMSSVTDNDTTGARSAYDRTLEQLAATVEDTTAGIHNLHRIAHGVNRYIYNLEEELRDRIGNIDNLHHVIDDLNRYICDLEEALRICSSF